MADVRLSRLEFQIMEVLWSRGDSSIRELADALGEASPRKCPPAYTTVQTTVYRMETKGAVSRLRKVGNFHIFSASVTREEAQRTLIDDLLSLLGSRPQSVMARLIETGKLSLEDVREAEKVLRKASKKGGRA